MINAGTYRLRKLWIFFPLLLFFILIAASSCTYRVADHYVTHKLKKNRLVFKELKLENYTISYWDTEEQGKPVLLLLHGFGTEGKFQWYKQVHALRKKYRLLIPDLLYFGNSTAKDPQYTIAEQVRGMEAFLKQLNVNDYYICGSSYGGVVAVELALKEEQKVRKLYLVAAPIKFCKMEDTKLVCEKYKIKDPDELYVPRDYKMLQTLIKVTYRKTPPTNTFALKTFYKNVYGENIETYKRLLEVFKKDEKRLRSRDYKFPFPVIIIWGDEDELTPKRIAFELKEHIGINSELHIIKKSAHLPNLEKADTFNKIILGE